MNDTITISEVGWLEAGDQLLAVRRTVFIDEQGVPPEMEVDEHDPAARHLLAIDAQRQPVATARLLANGHIGRMAVMQASRGRGIGTRMLQRLLDMAAEAGLKQAYLNAQCAAEAFYRREGFIPQGEIFEDAGIPHRRMTRQLDQSSG